MSRLAADLEAAVNARLEGGKITLAEIERSVVALIGTIERA
jgi:hypothetical protein